MDPHLIVNFWFYLFLCFFFQQTIIDSIHDEDDSFTGSGYTSLAIIYAVLAIMNWAAPSIISLIGPKIAMIIGGVTYLLVFQYYKYTFGHFYWKYLKQKFDRNTKDIFQYRSYHLRQNKSCFRYHLILHLLVCMY